MAVTKKGLKNIIIIGILVLLCLIVITASFREEKFLSDAREKTLDFFKPLQERVFSVTQPAVGFFSGIGQFFGMRQELTQLREENIRLHKDYAENINLRIENESLRSLLGIQIRSDYRVKAAKVIGFNESKWQSEALINVGKNDGVLEGMGVINERGLVGIVILSSASSSRVRLLNDPQSAIGSRMLSSRKLGMIEGGADKKIYLNYISKEETVFKGDVVITSEYGGFIPPEILIGTVKGEITGANETYRVLEVESFADLKKMENVLVILDW